MYYRITMTLFVLGAGLAPMGHVWGAFPDGYNHAELAFREFETPHFQIVYQEGLESIARDCATILEAVYPPICTDLQVWPREKTPVIINDFDDVGRNFAVRLEHRMYISQPVVNQARVGRREWLTHLLAHEFTHVVNYWALRQAYGEWGEWAGQELQPQWFTEGLAEYEGNRRARLESMFILRAAREGLLLPLPKLDLAANRIDLIETWLLYAQGYSMVVYLVETYGADVLRRLLHQYQQFPVFEVALRRTIGCGQREFYRDWFRQIREKQEKQLPAAEPLEEYTTVLPTPLEAALSARWSPDGRKIAVIGVKDWEEPVPALYVMKADGTGWKEITDHLDLYASPKFAWSPDSGKIVYTGRIQTKRGAVRNALFVVDLTTGQKRRISGELRAAEPAWSPNGEWIAFVLYEQETTKLALIRPDGTDLTTVTEGADFGAFQPAWSPDSTHLVFSLVDEQGTDLAVIHVATGQLQRLTRDVWPDQYPEWSPDGQRIAFVSVRGVSYAVAGEGEGLSGVVSNLFTVSPTGENLRQVTNAATGGVFYPAWQPDGETLALSLFRTRVAEIRLVPASRGLLVSPAEAAEEGRETKEETAGEEAEEAGEEAAEVVVEPAGAEAEPTATRLSSPRAYRPRRNLRRVISRPFLEEEGDGMGDVAGVRTLVTDPLQQHKLTLEIGRGLDSEQNHLQLSYVNDRRQTGLGINVFQRVLPVRLERAVGVYDRARGVELLARRPVAPSRSPFVKDVYSLGLEVAHQEPIAVAGALVPGPTSAQVNSLSLRWRRDALLPGTGSYTYLSKLDRAEKALGSDVNFTKGQVAYVRRWQVPSPRRLLTVGLQLDGFQGHSLDGFETDRVTFLGQLRYDWRVLDQVYQDGWPYVYLGRLFLRASYANLSLISGQAGGMSLQEEARVELENTGWITRGWSYKARLGERVSFGEGRRQSEFYTDLSIEVHDLAF